MSCHKKCKTITTGSEIAPTTAWLLTGNKGLAENNYLGSTDGKNVIISTGSPSTTNGFVFTNLGQLIFRKGNVFIGDVSTGAHTTSGINNIGIGNSALKYNTIGDDNIALGDHALFNNTSGTNNNAVGKHSLSLNTTGEGNSGFGAYSLKENNGNYNSSFGFSSLLLNSTGNFNNAFGFSSLGGNIDGERNNSFGTRALANSLTSCNSAFGDNCLFTNTVGFDNSGFGCSSMFFNLDGSENSSLGKRSLYNNTSGNKNVAIGLDSLITNIDGSQNTALGYKADVSSASLVNATAIGANAVVDDSDKIRLGDLNVTTVEGPLYSVVSDQRFKKDIKENVPGLAFIDKLKPVTYIFSNEVYGKFLNQKEHIDNKQQRTGFLAQEVHQAAQAIDYDFDGIIQPEINGGHYSLAYSSFVVPLVKAVQEQQRIIEKMQEKMEDMEKVIVQLMKK